MIDDTINNHQNIFVPLLTNSISLSGSMDKYFLKNRKKTERRFEKSYDAGNITTTDQRTNKKKQSYCCFHSAVAITIKMRLPVAILSS